MNPFDKLKPLEHYIAADPDVNQENEGCASNGVFNAVPWKAPATIALFPAYKFCKFEANVKKINAHADKITDVHWSPFNPQFLMSSSKDATMKLWEIPSEDGIAKDMKQSDAVLTLSGHNKDCLGFRWHHTAENLVASYSGDNTVRAWDVSSQKQLFCFETAKKKPTCMQWNHKGDMLSVNCSGGVF